MNWAAFALEALAFVRQLWSARRAESEVTASPVDIAIAQESGAAASRAGKEASKKR